jgi:hypothetical protein
MIKDKILSRSQIEIIGQSPNREYYEVFEGTNKRIELSFFENDNRFELYIEAIPGTKKIPGETTSLFAKIITKIQNKADELGKPVTLLLDPVNPKIENWSRDTVGSLLGGWDTQSKGRYTKVFIPRPNTPLVK